MIDASTVQEPVIQITVQNACLTGHEPAEYPGSYYEDSEIVTLLRPICEDYYSNYSRTWGGVVY